MTMLEPEEFWAIRFAEQLQIRRLKHQLLLPPELHLPPVSQ
jgi:hypothetical protein